MTPYHLHGQALVRYAHSGRCGPDCPGHEPACALVEVGQVIYAETPAEALRLMRGWVTGFAEWKWIVIKERSNNDERITIEH